MRVWSVVEDVEVLGEEVREISRFRDGCEDLG